MEGAKLVILEGVGQWPPGLRARPKLAKTLNVGITYLLREVEAGVAAWPTTSSSSSTTTAT
ncbi:MAG: hypothetical protein ACLTSX_13830 [Collinsella sp.]